LNQPVPRSRARKRTARALLWRRVAVAIAAIVLVVIAIGLAFAGSPTRLPKGVSIAGVPVGGMEAGAAQRELERRAHALADSPVTFTAAGHSWNVKPDQLGVDVDWKAAVHAALHQGPSAAPARGVYRLGVRIFGADVSPRAEAYDAALQFELNRFARAIDRPHRDAALRLKGLTPVIAGARSGRVLDRTSAARTVVQALAALGRSARVPLPVRVDEPRVTAADLAPVAAQVQTAVSAPVRLTVGPTRLRLPRYRVAALLDLPSDGARTLRIGGPGASDFFRRLGREIDRDPRDADWVLRAGNRVGVVPARVGRTLDAAATGNAILRAALSTTNRVAPVVVHEKQPRLTTAKARAYGIRELVSSYETIYGGDPNRIHNVQLVAHLIDHHLIAPGKEFSFNGTTGERNAAKGFLEAPVIINGELQTGLGGGVCQVSTTVFNTAYEAGLKITARTNHALYISHYPLGRDATVNYPDTDLRFVNDTGHWLLLRTFVGSSSLVVSLYGTNPHRRVVSEAAPLVETGPPPVKTEDDPNLFVGERVVDDSGEPSRATHVRRLVYAHGKLLYDNTWYSSYRGEPEIVRVGTKPKPKVVKKPPASTTTTSTTSTKSTSTTTTTAPTPTVPAPKPAAQP
jgi:vancomycin resistance protein YoaR